MYEHFTNLYSMSKTLRFSLIPEGSTEKHFCDMQFLEHDKKRAEQYKQVKGYMDRFHKQHIENCLSELIIEGFDRYAELYYKTDKKESDLADMANMEAEFRMEIANALTKHPNYKKMNGKEFIQELLPTFLTDPAEKKIAAEFEQFTTYFTGFFKNRENLYSEEAKATSIANRCIQENLPKYLDNARSFQKIKAALSEDDLNTLCDVFEGLMSYPPECYFQPDHFTFVLAQSQIDRYNELLGGYTTSDGKKIKGVNEYVNLFNQRNKDHRLPILKPLFKQILSERESVSFIPENFKNDRELLNSLAAFFAPGNEKQEGFFDACQKIENLLHEIETFDANGIFIPNDRAITDISNAVFGNWSLIRNAWNAEYEQRFPIGKHTREQYEENRAKKYKSQNSFSLAEIQRLAGDSEKSVLDWLKDETAAEAGMIKTAYKACEQLIRDGVPGEKKLAADPIATEKIKTLLDSVKSFELFLRPLNGTGKETKDEAFYGRFSPLYERLTTVDRLYDKVRNYLTQKPYSQEKIKINFDCSYFLNGWAQDYDKKKGALLFREKDNYFLGVIENKLTKEEKAYLTKSSAASDFERIVYEFQKIDNSNIPRLFIRSKGTSFAPAVRECKLPVESILPLYDNGYFKTAYRKKDPVLFRESLTKLIDYFKLGFQSYRIFRNFRFDWKDSDEYQDISEFYRDTRASCYTLGYEKINKAHLTEFIDAGKIYLFRIYSKDFSQYSHGKPNLHTLYFKMLFAEENLADVVYKLNGEAEMFFRPASIQKDEQIVHPANKPIRNKNPENDKTESVFGYDLVKDKRYTKNAFSLHIPITMNYKGEDRSSLDFAARGALKEKDNPHVIGIDRGERNLIYVCVIDGSGKIVEQHSLNEIGGDRGYTVDYHALLDKKEKERDEARKSWKSISTIKDLKEGYMSQVIHKVCELAVKYDSVIAMEDLNGGFKNSRVRVEKQVYQKFENMLTNKLNYLVIEKDPAKMHEPGGLLHAYQLTNKAGQNNPGRQNGILFYVPAWLTSKIDPSTGFTDLLKPKYTNAADASAFFAAFDEIRYDEKEDLFCFSFDYDNFKRGETDHRKKWTVWTYGDRIRTRRDPENNNQFISESICLTAAFKELFDLHGIDYRENLQTNVVKSEDPVFLKKLIELTALTLQMRNSRSGSTAPEDDYLISPVRNANGEFYDSRHYTGTTAPLPTDADANGAFNIARKALWAIRQIQITPEADLKQIKLAISNKEWLAFAQRNE